MIIERTRKELIVRLPLSVNTDEIQDILDFIRYKELTSKVKVKQTTVDQLASEINKKWWKKNKQKFVE